ncbi:amino acid permease/ SLC12A domain-containing protein [Pseudomassariella vexata]|uniref:Amino acid permease/ SLC12A domain-containing protein n=1 Tax=Pseudomassariella vexata TaxID=1141098 RepID=A0A1Y2EI48_9PEZI|nr:amino acid permease/ SLC12A domain-containing protein [Pseudomassariella vexata]ORY70974.1 amino acid permease/ SLC12A domain-containing protein [Pseudomassariella vexata]
MASTGIDHTSSTMPPRYSGDNSGDSSADKNGHDPEKDAFTPGQTHVPSLMNGVVRIDQTHRKLKARHIQLIGIGGTIGTALYVQLGRGLLQGGPGSLFLAFSFWCTVILSITLCMAEMVTYLPISSPFIRFAGRWVDEAFGFAAGWNFFVFEAVLVPFEITACNLIIHFWSDAVPAGGIIAIVIVLYGLINVLAVQWYGESEFWAALGKVILIVGLIIFTFIVMLGGNPQHDRFGFRYWYAPGAFAEWYETGDLGRFMGFMQCLIQASFTIAGPDYVSMAAGEAENPREVMPRAFNAVFYRLTSFFMLGSLCVGILVPYNDQTMADAFANAEPGAAASPYVIAMGRLGIPVLPHLVNAMVLTAAFSAGNSYVYCASRSLFGLALEGKAPKFLTKCLKNGVPIYSVMVVLIIALLSFLQVSANAATVLNWFVSLVTASQLINFSIICITYICFYRALEAQGIDRKSLPYRGFLQPYTAYYGLTACFIMTFVGGYTVFLPGKWDIPSFLFSYMMIIVFPILFLGWKIIHKTKFHKPAGADLHQNLLEIEEYQRTYVAIPAKSRFERILDLIFS